MILEDLIPFLNEYYFYPSKEFDKKGKLVGLKIESPNILMEDRIAFVQKITGDDFDVKQIKGEWNLRITEKKSPRKAK